MISLFAWRNLWRNKVRSLVIITALTLGVIAGIFLMAFMNGMVKARIDSIIGTEISHIQIHQPGFTDNDIFSLRIKNADKIVKEVAKTEHVNAVSMRIIITSMASSAETGTGVRIVGTDPQSEMEVTNLNSKIIEGKYLDNEGKNSIVIGEALAHKLNVGLKKKIIITVQDINKNITGGAFRVVGIFRTDNLMFDEANVFVRNTDLCSLTGIGENEAHEIAVLLDENKYNNELTEIISSQYPSLEVKNWMQISPEAGYLVGAMNQYMYIFIIVILLALCFGIINTILMVVLERVRELGMLMAIGMNKTRIFKMIMLETIYLSLSGGILGVSTGFLISRYFGHLGINLFFWKEAFADIGFSSMVYPEIEFKTIIVVTIMVVITGVFSSLYPAYKALKLNPSQEIRNI